MKRILAVAVSMAFLVSFAPVVDAQSCPPEVTKAKELLNKKAATAKVQEVHAPRSLAGARQDFQAPRGQDTQAPRGQEVQAPRSLAGARSQDFQAPRGQDTQAPRGQISQAPRGQDTQAPRGQDTQAPRGQTSQAPRGQDTQAPRGQDTQAPRSLAGAKLSGNVMAKASALIKEAEAACKAGDMTSSKAKAEAAISVLK